MENMGHGDWGTWDMRNMGHGEHGTWDMGNRDMGNMGHGGHGEHGTFEKKGLVDICTDLGSFIGIFDCGYFTVWKFSNIPVSSHFDFT